MNNQIELVHRFERYLRPLRIIYPFSAFRLTTLNFEEEDSTSVASNDMSRVPTGALKSDFSLHTFLFRQKLVLHGAESRTLRYIPKVKKRYFLPFYITFLLSNGFIFQDNLHYWWTTEKAGL
jgi:hypothetical protein